MPDTSELGAEKEWFHRCWPIRRYLWLFLLACICKFFFTPLQLSFSLFFLVFLIPIPSLLASTVFLRSYFLSSSFLPPYSLVLFPVILCFHSPSLPLCISFLFPFFCSAFIPVLPIPPIPPHLLCLHTLSSYFPSLYQPPCIFLYLSHPKYLSLSPIFFHSFPRVTCAFSPYAFIFEIPLISLSLSLSEVLHSHYFTSLYSLYDNVLNKLTQEASILLILSSSLVWNKNIVCVRVCVYTINYKLSELWQLYTWEVDVV